MENSIFCYSELLGELRYDEIYIFYNVPQVFTAVGKLEKYLCMLIQENPYKWLSCSTSDDELKMVDIGLVDLRYIFKNKQHLYVIDDKGNDLAVIHSFETVVVPENYFPLAGLYLAENAYRLAALNDAEVLHKKVEFRFLSRLTEKHTIPLHYCVKALEGIRSLINGAAATIEGIKNIRSIADNYVAAFSPGSLKVSISPADFPESDPDVNKDQMDFIAYKSKETAVIDAVYSAMKEIYLISTGERDINVVLLENISLNSKICEGILSLNSTVCDDNFHLETTFDFFDEKNHKESKRVIIFDQTVFFATKQIYDFLIARETRANTVIVGKVTMLSRQPEDINSPIISVKGSAWGLDGARKKEGPRSYTIPVSVQQYDMAWNAHRNSLDVIVKGIIDTSDKFYRFLEVQSFEVVDAGKQAHL